MINFLQNSLQVIIWCTKWTQGIGIYKCVQNTSYHFSRLLVLKEKKNS